MKARLYPPQGQGREWRQNIPGQRRVMFEEVDVRQFPVRDPASGMECDGFIVHKSAGLGDPDAQDGNQHDEKPGEPQNHPSSNERSALGWDQRQWDAIHFYAHRISLSSCRPGAMGTACNSS